MAEHIPAWTEEFSRPGGVGTWARRTMGRRLGSHFPPEGADWWSNLMGRTPESTQVGFMKVIPIANIEADLPRIKCPTMVVTTEGSALGSVDKTRQWQSMIPNSRLLVLPGDSYHVATSHAEQCAAATLAFIKEVSK